MGSQQLFAQAGLNCDPPDLSGSDVSHWHLAFYFIFEIGFHYVAQTGHELTIILLLPPEYWDYRHASPCPVDFFNCNKIYIT
jgi:hypothetical protein